MPARFLGSRYGSASGLPASSLGKPLFDFTDWPTLTEKNMTRDRSQQPDRKLDAGAAEFPQDADLTGKTFRHSHHAAAHDQTFGERIEHALDQGDFKSALAAAKDAAGALPSEEFGMLMLRLVEGLYNSLPQTLLAPANLDDALGMMDWDCAFKMAYGQRKQLEQGQITHEEYSAFCTKLMVPLTDADPAKANAFMRVHRDALGPIGCGEVLDAVFLALNAVSPRSSMAAGAVIREQHTYIDEFRADAYVRIAGEMGHHKGIVEARFDWVPLQGGGLGVVDAYHAILRDRGEKFEFGRFRPQAYAAAIETAQSRNNRQDELLLVAFARALGGPEARNSEPLRHVISARDWNSKEVRDLIRRLGWPSKKDSD
jgi:hypothetical protein